MTLDQLQAFLAVVEFRHFGRAASHLNITQPATTKRIASLEGNWGGPLFVRSPEGLSLTRLAEGMLDGTRRIIAETAVLNEAAQDFVAGRRGRLTIGFGLSTLDLAPRLIAEYRARHSGIAISLNDYSSAEQVERLLARQLDLGFVRLPVGKTLASKPLLTECLVLATTQPQAELHDGDLQMLNEVGFVMLARHRGPGLASQIERWSEANAFKPRIVQTAADIQTVLSLVAAGVGHAILPSRSARIATPSVQFAALKGRNRDWQVGVVWRCDDRNPILEDFLRMIDELRTTIEKFGRDPRSQHRTPPPAVRGKVDNEQR